MKTTQFKISTKTGILVLGEYCGNIKSKKIVIFVQGFGVLRDSRGMFTHIANYLKDKVGIILFDLNEVEGLNVTTYSGDTQSEMLDAVMLYAKRELGADILDCIAHSRGNYTVGWSPHKFRKVLLLSPPPLSNPNIRLKKRLSNIAGSIYNEKGTSIWTGRADGTTTYITKEYLKDMENINITELTKTVIANSEECKMIVPLEDELHNKDDYSEIFAIDGLSSVQLKGTHNFEGDSRKGLVREILMFLGYK